MGTNYKEMIDKSYNEIISNTCNPQTKLEFLGNYIFDFVTYDSNLDEYFAKKMIEVLDVILNRATFQYIDLSHDNYLNFITMCNMQFLSDKIEYGTSIRGSWFDDIGMGSYTIHDIDVPKTDFKLFIKGLIEFSS